MFCLYTKLGFYKCHVCAAVNPNEVKQELQQQSFSFNVWVGILGDCLIGPHFLPHRLNGEQYLRFLRNDLPNLLEDVPLRQHQQMWFMHDNGGANHDTQGKRFKSPIYCCDVTKPPYLFSGELCTSPLHCKLLFVYTVCCRRTG